MSYRGLPIAGTLATILNPHELNGYVEYDGGTAWNESDDYYYHLATGAVTHAEPFGQKYLPEPGGKVLIVTRSILFAANHI